MDFLKETLGGGVIGKSGDVDFSSITGAGRTLGLYFSAHWCPPCRGFTPKLGKKWASCDELQTFFL